MIAASENTETARRPTPRQNEDPRDVLGVVARELRQTFAARIAIDPAGTPEGSSAALTIRVDGEDFATFGVLDATYYWTFDGGESCHYAKDKAVMKRFLTLELSTAVDKGGASP